jgi:pilus assembly protein CpaE
MSGPIKALVALELGVDRHLVEAALPQQSEVQVVGVVEGFDEAWRVLEESPTDLLIVACAASSDRALYLIDGAVKQEPDRPVIVLCQGSVNGFVGRVFAAGADDFLSLPESSDNVRFALQKAVARRSGAALATGPSASPMICILGPKGGTGKTLTACNLAVGLAQAGRRVALVDLDLQFGDVGLALGLAPNKTIYDLARAGGSIDAEKVSDYLTRHPSGVDVLLAPTRPDHAGLITVEFLREVYAALRSSHDVLVVDTCPGFAPEVIASIDSSSDVCMVAMLDSLSLKNTKLGIETLDLMGYAPDRVKLVLNRADTRVGITPADVEAILGRAPDVLVPSDREVPLSVNEAVPIIISKDRSIAAQAFRGLADAYLERSGTVSANGSSPTGRRSLLRRGA